MDAHKSVFRRLYAYEDFYDALSDGLSALISLDVDNFPDAVRELRNFCSRSHHSSTLCDYCWVTKTSLKEWATKSIPSTGFFFQLLHVFSQVDIRSINIRTFNDFPVYFF